VTYKTEYDTVKPYVTRDRSLIRELLHPLAHGNHNQSVAEASVDVGQQTRLHRHYRSEEIYHVLSGSGRMRVGASVFDIGCGDTIWIPAGAVHNVVNSGDQTLKILCCSAPPYAHQDTELVDEDVD
jgi:mannose-6-phosphate isomerase-like protein (cupin superfamily)